MSEPEAAEEPLLQSCQNCGTLLDISELEPFAQIHCPSCGTSMRARTQVKNFTLQEVLGAGGMGAVYKAIDVNLNRMVALKVVRKEFSADKEYLEKFEREAMITASVTHPHVVKVFSFGQDHGLFYIAMELVDKGSLDDLMTLQGRVAEAQVMDVGIQIADGLNAAHQRGLIHRDVKPGNILFADARSAKIVDFGLALLMEHEAEARGEVWGTPYYVAPEKLNHEPEDFRSDIYSLGGTLFHALAGRPPFEAETASLVALKHIKSQAVSLQAFAPNVSSATAYVINRMLHKDPDQRYQSYEELIEHLQYARAQLNDAGTGARPKARVVMESRKQQAIMAWITIGLLASMLIGGGLMYVFRDRIFHKDEDAEGVREEKIPPAVAASDEAGRKKLAAGDAEGAYGIFKKLSVDGEKPLPQPLRNWITYHAGLSAFLAAHPSEATAEFKKLETRGVFSNDPAQKALAGMFVETGRLMTAPGAVPLNATRQFNNSNFEAAALLALGLKNWELGKIEEGGAILKNFAAGDPQPPFAWLADYRPLAQKYVADAESYRLADEKMKAASTPAEFGDAMEGLVKARNNAQTKGKIIEKFNQLETALKKRISSGA